MDIIQTNSSHCGSGKTCDATIAACNGITENRKTCISVPSRKLAKQVQRNAHHDYPQLTTRIACFVSNPRKGEPAISRITKYT
jgi:replicative superfamily II helicase